MRYAAGCQCQRSKSNRPCLVLTLRTGPNLDNYRNPNMAVHEYASQFILTASRRPSALCETFPGCGSAAPESGFASPEIADRPDGVDLGDDAISEIRRPAFERRLDAVQRPCGQVRHAPLSQGGNPQV
jgi:hypothetical protein